MKVRPAMLCLPVALGLGLACRDSSTGLLGGGRSKSPSFATVSDTGGGGGPGNQSHFVANGESAEVSWSFGTPGDSGGGGGSATFGSLQVSRGGPTGDPQTFLSYFIERCDASGCQDFGGSGLIPNQDFTGAGNSRQVKTNTIGNPDFSTFAGPAGVIAVQWNTNGLLERSATGTFEITMPNFRQRQTGGSSSASANAVGSAVGEEIPANNSASIGSNQSVTINVFH